MRILVTGGAGFIGSNFIRHILNKNPDYKIVNLDKLTYAGNLDNLKDVEKNPSYAFIKGDICDSKIVDKAIKGCDCLLNFAAETHVDRSIHNASNFIATNMHGTYVLLEAAKKVSIKKFIHISCYDTKTRALTTEGLKTYKELKRGDKIFSLNPKTLEIEIKPIEKVIIQPYKGEMVYFNNKRIDLLVTPNHSMFILSTNKKKLLIEAANKASQRSIFYMAEGYWVGKNEEYFDLKDYGRVKTKDLMYILGIFIGDGFTAYQTRHVETKTGLAREEYLKKSRDKGGRFKEIEKQGNHKSTCNSYRIFFDVPEHDKCRKKVEKALFNLGIKYHCHKGRAGTHLYFTSKIFMNFFDQCGRGASDKHIPRWALDYSPKYLRCLLQGLMDADGHNSKIYYTVSQRLCSDISELCVKLNLKPSIHERYTTSFITNRKIEGSSSYIFVGSTIKSISRHKINMINYEGDVWCLKVKENKNFLVERNGKFDFCGNTDEVYGSIEKGSFTEESPLKPNSPYAASKAAADFLVRSYFVTYKMPLVITRSSNNFGPYQFPEKFVSLSITNLIEGKKIPLYGTGRNVRDWIYVEDNCDAIYFIMKKGRPGEIYNIAGRNEISNIEMAKQILRLMGKPRSEIELVKDRLGHDWRYSLDGDKLRKLGWRPKYDFREALAKTIEWYKRNTVWWKAIKGKTQYKKYYNKQYKGRGK